MSSIYHFFQDLLEKKNQFQQTVKLEDFPFSKDLLSSTNKGLFPDLSIKINASGTTFTGGELIELKDSISYQISSFNSTIPTGQKNLLEIIGDGKSVIREQMEKD